MSPCWITLSSIPREQRHGRSGEADLTCLPNRLGRQKSGHLQPPWLLARLARMLVRAPQKDWREQGFRTSSVFTVEHYQAPVRDRLREGVFSFFAPSLKPKIINNQKLVTSKAQGVACYSHTNYLNPNQLCGNCSSPPPPLGKFADSLTNGTLSCIDPKLGIRSAITEAPCITGSRRRAFLHRD